MTSTATAASPVLDPPWLREARKHIGEREILGTRHSAKVVGWWRAIGSHFRDDETPWCAAFVGGCLEAVGIRSTRSAAARSYQHWAREIAAPRVGAIVVFWRGKPSGPFGHVGFVVGRDKVGNLMVLGGNQGNAVNIRPFDSARVLTYRWPIGVDVPKIGLPVMTSDGRLSSNEA